MQKYNKILTQFQGRSRIPEGTSQRLGGWRGLAKHKEVRKLHSGQISRSDNVLYLEL